MTAATLTHLRRTLAAPPFASVPGAPFTNTVNAYCVSPFLCPAAGLYGSPDCKNEHTVSA